MENIRKANKFDVIAISEVHARSWKEGYKGLISEKYLKKIYDRLWVPKFIQILNDNEYMVSLYTVDGKVTGCITYGKEQDCIVPTVTEEIKREGMAEIVTFYVLPEYWGKMQGYKLATFAEKILKDMGYKGCYVWVLYGNERAIKFYEKFGFREEKVFTKSFVGKEETIEQRYYKKY
ncbi:GNAT family N-acetyltransferase [Clostridium paraputrificum]|uniref:GNAT family N-acetyltransferase n=1 Tax=Clostridium TaxID=1485 RepID=UPI003D335849